MPTSEPNITIMVETFAFQITAAVEASVADRIQAAIAGAFGARPARGMGRPTKAVAGVARVAAKPSAVKRTKKMTPKLARARKLQGQYMGALKSLKGAERARVKAVAKDKGVAEAVKLAQGMKKAK